MAKKKPVILARKKALLANHQNFKIEIEMYTPKVVLSGYVSWNITTKFRALHVTYLVREHSLPKQRNK